ncbi:MAG: NAD kinase [Candidatus Symbiothrix sp.]|jgi:NAD+ kinase|nr:NAD kinase [Candidatus Symbiothrix sp.]
MKIGIFGSDYQADKQQIIKQLFDRLAAQHAALWVEKHFYRFLTEKISFYPDIQGIIESNKFDLDMVISLGGDGTFLRTAAWVGNQNIPVLGINTGRLGFLADIDAADMDAALDEIFQNNYRLEERILLQLNASFDLHKNCPYALNELAILKRDTSSMIAVSTYLNDVFLTKYWADGLLIATPTGSTAYNLSVNGPIILPPSNHIVLSPVAPHALNVRPLVIPADYKIRMVVESRSKTFLVSLDGRSETVHSGCEFCVQKADFKIKLIKRQQQNFYKTLRKKLMWGSDVRQ